MKNEPIIMDEEDYLSINGYSSFGIGEAALHKADQCTSQKAWSKMVSRQSEKDREYIENRILLRKEYKEKVAKGELRPRNRMERLLLAAEGEPSLESTQAAKKLLLKMKNMSNFKVGDMVQFNLGEDYHLNGCYGQIDKINKTNIRVYIPKKYSWIYGYEYHQKKRFTDSFKPSQLKPVGRIEDFPEIRASLLYNKSYHSLSTYKYKFSSKNDCSVEGCNCKAAKRILYNCWGTVSEFDVCEEHAKYDGYCGDGFPHKKNYHPVDMNEIS